MEEKHSLETFLKDIRCFLEPIWIKAHKSWDDAPVPAPPSKYMCRYSCLFLRKLLKNYGYGKWFIELGRPLSPELNGTEDGKFGYLATDGKWYDHTWLVKDGIIIDITADQYGGDPITIAPIGSTKYNANLTEDNVIKDFKKLEKRVHSWIYLWLKQEKSPNDTIK